MTEPIHGTHGGFRHNCAPRPPRSGHQDIADDFFRRRRSARLRRFHGPAHSSEHIEFPTGVKAGVKEVLLATEAEGAAASAATPAPGGSA